MNVTSLEKRKMPDISKCNPGTICPHREKCYRFTAPADEYQAYFTEPPIKADGTCDFFWGKTQTDILTQLKEIVKG
jgi:hypothetical protein